MYGFVRVVPLTVSVIMVLSVGAKTQPRDSWGRISIHVNGGYGVPIKETKNRHQFVGYGEEGSFESTHDSVGTELFEGGGSVRLWRNLAIGATYSEFNRRVETAVTINLPHPFLLNQYRAAGPQTLDLRQRQRATHIQFVIPIPVPLWERLEFTMAGGPSFINITQGAVTNIDVSEVGPPYDSVKVNLMDSEEYVVNGFGVNIGFDVTCMLTNHLGAGVFVRSVIGSIDMPVPGSKVSLDAVQAGAGIRVKF